MADREKVLTWLKKCGKGGCSSRCPYDDLGPDKCYETLMIEALELLKEQPEQKHGHWIKSPKFLPETQCSVCKKTYVGDCRMFKFCPDCGARMDEEVSQDG